MTPASFSPNLIRRRLGKLSAHIVVALIALVVIGGATRVMEAGLACPDWPLCFGSFLPIGEMNAKVFLEWFHRLDAFFIGIAITLQLLFSLIYSSVLPRWLPWMNLIILLLVVFQGALGALTVINLLPSSVVIGHLFLALTLVALMSGLSQKLLLSNGTNSPSWWKLCSGGSLLLILSQSLLGSRMATTWAAQKCIANGTDCYWLGLHKVSAIPVALIIVTFVCVSLLLGGWFRSQWPLLLSLLFFLIMQITLGLLSVHLSLSEPFVRVFHQLFASLLVACLAALSCRTPALSSSSTCLAFEDSSLEVCHG